MASSKSRSGRSSQTVLSGATLYDVEEEETVQPPRKSSILRKQRQLNESTQRDRRSPLPREVMGQSFRESLKQLVHSKTSPHTIDISYVESLARQDDTGQKAPLNKIESGKRVTQGPKGNVAFVEDADYDGESDSPSTKSTSSFDSIHPSDTASDKILPTMMPQSQPQVSDSLQPPRQTKQTRPNNGTCIHVNPQNPQDVAILTELDMTDDLEEDLEEYSRLVRMGRFKAARIYFDDRLVHFIDNLYILDQYCSTLLAMSDFQALSRIAKEFAMELRPGIYLINILTRFLQAEVLGGLEILSNEAKNKYSSYIADDLETLTEIRNHWPELDSTELQMMMDSFSIKGGINYFRPLQCAPVYPHLKAEGRIWDFKDLLDRLLRMESTSVCTTLRLLLQSYGDDNDGHLTILLQRIEDDWGSAADEVSSFALLEIFTTLTLASMSRQTSILMVKKIFQFAQGHAQDILEANPINSKTRPYLCWIVTKVLVEQYKNPKMTGIFALASHLKRLPGKSWQPEVALPLSWMVLYAPYEDEDPKWHPDPSTTAGHDNALRTVLGVAEQLGDTPLQATCLQLLIYQCPQPRLLLDKLGDLWRSKGAYLGYIQTRMYCFIPESLSTPETRESIRRDILLAGEVSSGGPVSHARSMILRALSPGDPSHLEKNLYLGRAWEAISIPGYPSTGTQEKNGRPNEEPKPN
ncbi:hypothetical protein CSPX01_10390 [Colletotrichum filicis]|nr:hypothetical protein CSPX01_10390 [Colletotrichum filicis]